MKLSTHYKQQDYQVDIKKLHYSGYPDKRIKTIIDASNYDKTFVSTIFTINNGWVEIQNCNEVIFGGTGYDISLTLPQEIDDCDEDYTIYPENDKSYGFITIGCIRNCPFVLSQERKGC
jgi:hypothetical protein